MAGHTQALFAGRYRRIEPIGVGGMARVFLAEDERLGRRVAVKQLHSESPGEAAERFEREAKLGASLNHPNLVSIYDIASDAESVLIVMEYVEGETLKDALEGGPLSAPRVVSIVHDVAAALGHAHAQGIVHRDVKPANILLRSDGVTKLADLGIATAAESTSITKSGMVLGTASYMAPEQLDGERAGPAADVYALAAVAFEALSGRKALSGDTPMEIAHKVVSQPPPDLREGWPEAPAAAAAALRRGMARRPGDRFASAGELAAALQRGLREAGDDEAMAPTAPSTPAQAGPAPLVRSHAGGTAPREDRRTYHRRPGPAWLPAAAAAAALCVLVGVGLAVLGGGGDEGGSASREEAAKPAKDRPTREAPAREAGSDAASGGQTSNAGAGSGSGASSSGKGSGDPAALNSQGFKLMNEGRYDDAIPLLQKAVAAYPADSTELTYAYALYNLGKSLRLAGRPKEAVPVLERRLRIPNQTATVRRELEAARRAAG